MVRDRLSRGVTRCAVKVSICDREKLLSLTSPSPFINLSMEKPQEGLSGSHLQLVSVLAQGTHDALRHSWNALEIVLPSPEGTWAGTGGFHLLTHVEKKRTDVWSFHKKVRFKIFF